MWAKDSIYYELKGFDEISLRRQIKDRVLSHHNARTLFSSVGLVAIEDEGKKL